MRRPIAILALFASLSLAACSSGGGDPTTAPASEPPAAASEPPAPASEPAASAAAGGGGGAGCQPSTDPATVTADILDFSFSPADIQATVGDVVGFTNAGSAPHTATLDEGDCSTETLDGGASGALAFTSAGTFPFHCRIHSAMTGTITVTE
jgi:plastocyanin